MKSLVRMLGPALVIAALAPAAHAQKAPTLQTTVTGQQETPLGLYIIPWRNSDATGGADKPARLLDEALLPHDAEVFSREIEFHRALSEHLEQQGKITPDSR